MSSIVHSSLRQMWHFKRHAGAPFLFFNTLGEASFDDDDDDEDEDDDDDEDEDEDDDDDEDEDDDDDDGRDQYIGNCCSASKASTSTAAESSAALGADRFLRSLVFIPPSLIL